MSSRRQVIHVGDKVRILNDKFVKRVGYPLHWEMVAEEVENDPRTKEALTVLGLVPPVGTSLDNLFPIPHIFVEAVAKLRVRQLKYGGKERSIWYEDPTHGFALGENGTMVASWIGQVVTVYNKRVVKTGTYYPPSGGYDWYSGDYDYTPGGLSNMKTHIILTTYAGDIEACNVEVVERLGE